MMTVTVTRQSTARKFSGHDTLRLWIWILQRIYSATKSLITYWHCTNVAQVNRHRNTLLKKLLPSCKIRRCTYTRAHENMQHAAHTLSAFTCRMEMHCLVQVYIPTRLRIWRYLFHTATFQKAYLFGIFQHKSCRMCFKRFVRKHTLCIWRKLLHTHLLLVPILEGSWSTWIFSKEKKKNLKVTHAEYLTWLNVIDHWNLTYKKKIRIIPPSCLTGLDLCPKS